ncbi:Type V secretory pathway, adhesin AidA [Citrobacter freundii]|uniref:Type V secretory pathway, adhesin AidA n=1 Tax=Citrobacter freundii TaxID=546 RepID=A0A7G2IMN4_CITFR|nr:Type V secretory pathway, adhesin AidA [Citrobacter freundii]
MNANGVTLQFWDGATVNQSHGASGIEGDSKIDGGDGKWMAIGSQGDNNWTTATGEGNAPWAQKSFAVFTTKGGTVTVDNAAGEVNFSGAQFDADGYVVKGDALNAYATTEKTRPTQARRRGLANCWCALALVARGKTIPRPLSPLSARPVLLTS